MLYSNVMFDFDEHEIAYPSNEVLTYGASISYIEEVARRVIDDQSVPKSLFLMLAVEFCKDTVKDLEVCNRIWDYNTIVSEMAEKF